MWLEKTWYLHDNQHVYIRDKFDKTNKMYQRNRWFFDIKSKTIRNTDWNKDTHAVDVRGALRMQKVDSRWYQMFDLRVGGHIGVPVHHTHVLTVQHHQDINDRHVVREGKQSQE